MRARTFLLVLMLLIAMMLLVIATPYIGLGADYDFILWKHYGLRRGLAVSCPTAIIYLLCIYQALSLGVPGTSQTQRLFNTFTQAWRDGRAIWNGLTEQTAANLGGQTWPTCVAIFAGAAGLFGLFIYKDLALFEI